MQAIIIISFSFLFILYLIFSHYQYNKKITPSENPGDGVKSCMFCGSKKLSHEHVFPEWVKNVTPLGSSYPQLDSNIYHVKKREESVKSKKTDFKSNIGSKKLRIVCHNCNNQWMSELQKINKSTIIKLIKNENITLDSESQQNLSSWCTMMTMVGERVFEPPFVIPYENRATFFNTRKPLESWHIWIGKNTSKRKMGLFRFPFTFVYVNPSPSGTPVNFIDAGSKPNAIFFMYVIDNFIFFALYDIRNKPITLSKEIQSKLALIHPQAQKKLIIEKLTSVNDKDLENLIAFFGSFA